MNELEEVERYIENMDYDNVLEWACNHHNYEEEKEIIDKVIECYEMCIEEDYVRAYYNLGTIYYDGIAVKQDYDKAFELYKYAADRWHGDAMCGMGYCYYYGKSVTVDYKKAYEYFSKSALLYNHARCLYKIGDMYLNGYYVEKNETNAFILYDRAFEVIMNSENYDYSEPDIRLRLGKCFLYGYGVAKNSEQAYMLLSDALKGFYLRRKTDIFIKDIIEETKGLIFAAERTLNNEIIRISE